MYILYRTLAYLIVNSKMKLFFYALFFSINKLHYCYNKYISIYIGDSFPFSLSLFLSSPRSFLVLAQIPRK